MTFGHTQEVKKISPISSYFDWKSNKDKKTGMFKGWNKALEQEVEVLPTEFILLETTSCVKGWDNKNNCGIYSNEIKNIKHQELIIRSFNGGEIYKGVYDREKITGLGCKFNKGIIAQEGDIMVEYYLSGGSLLTRNEQTEGIDYQNYKIKFDGVEEKKNGAIIYYVPKWTQGSKITDMEREVAMHNVDLLEDYFKDE